MDVFNNLYFLTLEICRNMGKTKVLKVDFKKCVNLLKNLKVCLILPCDQHYFKSKAV